MELRTWLRLMAQHTTRILAFDVARLIEPATIVWQFKEPFGFDRTALLSRSIS